MGSGWFQRFLHSLNHLASFNWFREAEEFCVIFLIEAAYTYLGIQVLRVLRTI